MKEPSRNPTSVANKATAQIFRRGSRHKRSPTKPEDVRKRYKALIDLFIV